MGCRWCDGDTNSGRLWSFIHRFRMRVDLELPDMYNWFADCSLHVTLTRHHRLSVISGGVCDWPRANCAVPAPDIFG